MPEPTETGDLSFEEVLSNFEIKTENGHLTTIRKGSELITPTDIVFDISTDGIKDLITKDDYKRAVDDILQLCYDYKATGIKAKMPLENSADNSPNEQLITVYPGNCDNPKELAQKISEVLNKYQITEDQDGNHTGKKVSEGVRARLEGSPNIFIHSAIAHVDDEETRDAISKKLEKLE